ncbi:YfjI family protein [Yokenella regensburgei]|uniref:DUF3987 domain-containing protein n=1 Tax=Yokenella regensburgei TaxID=158877 RepID=A0AB38FUF6_9ENTR|nr:YfjI family protein [Yokenella regensburgei]KFD24827.1 hypothetical protein GYRE_00801 [Yokenella regensburgei ATCC 49455]SQA62958.1 Uncharacterised protein [Yokenella regensburgei]SQB02201.1 Uncharacterised protein [Yokenella regensburgei]SUQ07497.1 Uncharacterised protein [Yokenella regensburgei]
MKKSDFQWVKLSTRAERSEFANEQPLPPYPEHLFSVALSEPLNELHRNTRIPDELTGNIVLSAASLACQSLIEVIHPHTSVPEPCSLYFFTIAESGAGKSTIKNKVMKPFYDFDEKMRLEHIKQMSAYDAKFEIWKCKRKALVRNLNKAIDRNYSGEPESRELEKHNKARPHPPILPQIIYNDTSATDLIQGLSQYSDAGLITDEAITYFGSRPKSKIGFLNNAWDGSPYHFRRSGKTDCHFTPCLTASLMTQTAIFDGFMEAHGDVFKESGFLSRFLFSRIDDLKHFAEGTHSSKTTWSAINNFHQLLNDLLDKKKTRIDEQTTTRKQLRLSPAATTLWEKHREQLLLKMVPAGELYYIRDFAAKASANVLRLSAIFQYLSNECEEEINEDIMQNCTGIIDWYLNAINRIFFYTPERLRFIQDVKKLYRFILNGCIKNKNSRFITFSEIEQLGPNNLRRLEKLMPVLNHLIGQGEVKIRRDTLNETIMLVARNHEGLYLMPGNKRSDNIQEADSTPFTPNFYIDLEDIRLNTKQETKSG